MSDKPVLTPEIHKRQIEAYAKVRPRFVTYADALRRVLERACQVSFRTLLCRRAPRPYPASPRRRLAIRQISRLPSTR